MYKISCTKDELFSGHVFSHPLSPTAVVAGCWAPPGERAQPRKGSYSFCATQPPMWPVSVCSRQGNAWGVDSHRKNSVNDCSDGFVANRRSAPETPSVVTVDHADIVSTPKSVTTRSLSQSDTFSLTTAIILQHTLRSSTSVAQGRDTKLTWA